MTSGIEANELTKTYGDIHAVAAVDFEVAEGEIFGYLGRNGSGKTTTVRMLTTLTRPTSGTALVAGFDVVASPAAVKNRIGVTMQEAALDPQMTGREHLKFVAGILGYRGTALSKHTDAMLELFGLGDAADRTIRTYSGGMQRRLDISTALLGEPKVLFLDEPTTGLDPQSRLALWTEIRKLKQRGATVFLTTQYLEEADQLSDHLAIIDRGSIIASGTAAGLKAKYGRKRIIFNSPDAVQTDAQLSGWIPSAEVATEDGSTRIELSPDTTDRDVYRLIEQINTRLGARSGLQVIEPSLEDVFLRLTGLDINQRALQDEPA